MPTPAHPLLIAILGLSLPAFAQQPGQNLGPTTGSYSGTAQQPDPAGQKPCLGPTAPYRPECQGMQADDDPDTDPRIAAPQPPDDKNDSEPQNRSIRTPANRRDRLMQTPLDQSEPAAPPTEFQKFVAISAGKILPIFGASLFEKAPSTFAPVDRVPVTADYRLGPGDEILLRVWGQVSLNLKLTVDRAGAIFIPQVGTVDLGGIEFRQLPGYLKSQLSRVYRNFDLTVSMGRLRSIQIFVVGQARRPGSYTVSSLSTLVNALFACGGPSAEGSMRRIQLKRGPKTVTELDLYDLLLKGDKTKDARLNSGDVVYIPPVQKQVAVAGSVRNPGIYELAGDKSVADVIQMAGGLSAVADLRNATIERIQQRSSREALTIQLEGNGLTADVNDGDFLNVRAIQPRFVNTVTLRGNVASPGRFPWRKGLRVKDVIPDKESLITRDYWSRHNMLVGKPEEEKPARKDAGGAAEKPKLTAIELTVPEINWSYAVIERQTLRDLSTEMIPFRLGALLLDNDESQNLPLEPGDVITIFSQADVRVSQTQQTRMIRLEGEFNSAGYYTVRSGETLASIIQRAGGLSGQAYLYGAELIRESTKKDQKKRLEEYTRELEREIQRASVSKVGGAATADESAAAMAQLERDRQMVEKLRGVEPTGRIVLHLDPQGADLSKLAGIALEDGDRFIVPAKPATVNVIGAVYNQGAFVHEAKAKAQDYLRQAGGFSREADKARIFIIRADGTVVPKQNTRHFESVLLYPGDSLTIPDITFKTSVLKELRDWTQVFSQLALGAAAVNVLR